MSLSEVAATGDRIKTLEATRDYLAKAIEECHSDRDRAALVARFMDCVDRIDGIKPDETETAAERIKRRAEERRAAAQEAVEGSESG